MMGIYEDPAAEIIELKDEVDRLKKRTHEIQEKESAKYGRLIKEYRDCQLHLEVWESMIRKGQDWYWDEVQLAKRPLNLSRMDAAKMGLLLNEIECLRMETGIEQLEKQNAELKRQLTNQRDNNHERNIELDALHYIWCSGHCESGSHRWTDIEITDEIVEAAVRNTNRLVAKWGNSKIKPIKSRVVKKGG